MEGPPEPAKPSLPVRSVKPPVSIACTFDTSVRLVYSTLSIGDGSFGKLLAQLAKTNLLIIDDWSSDVLSKQQRNDLLEVIEGRMVRPSSQASYQCTHWHEAIGYSTRADAILD